MARVHAGRAREGTDPLADAIALEVLSDVAIYSGELGAVDVLFNCAGFVANGTILDVTDRDACLAAVRTARNAREGTQ